MDDPGPGDGRGLYQVGCADDVAGPDRTRAVACTDCRGRVKYHIPAHRSLFQRTHIEDIALDQGSADFLEPRGPGRVANESGNAPSIGMQALYDVGTEHAAGSGYQCRFHNRSLPESGSA